MIEKEGFIYNSNRVEKFLKLAKLLVFFSFFLIFYSFVFAQVGYAQTCSCYYSREIDPKYLCTGSSGSTTCDPIYCYSPECFIQWDTGSGTCKVKCGSSCFAPETEISTPEGAKAIKDLETGETVKSFNPETGESTTGEVEKLHEVTRSGYFRLKLKSGKEVRVTGEHPLYAIVKPLEEATQTFWELFNVNSLWKKAINYIKGLR